MARAIPRFYLTFCIKTCSSCPKDAQHTIRFAPDAPSPEMLEVFFCPPHSILHNLKFRLCKFDPLAVSELILEADDVPDRAAMLPFCVWQDAVWLLSMSYKCPTFNGPTVIVMLFLSAGVAVHVRILGLDKAFQGSAAGPHEDRHMDLIHKLVGVCSELCISHSELSLVCT
jgi:hypothetical protein